MEKLGITYNTHAEGEAEHGHSHSTVVTTPLPHDLETAAAASPMLDDSSPSTPIKSKKFADEGSYTTPPPLNRQDSDVARVDYDSSTAEGVAQLIAVGVLEFGVVLHSIIIGLTLSVSDEFITLFIVIIFHRECIHGDGPETH